MLNVNGAIFSYIMARTSYIRPDGNDVRFVLDQTALLYIHSALSLHQQSTIRHTAPPGHIILILSQTVCALSF